jgi:hypothetical protein
MSATPEAATETRTNGQNENQQIATVPAAASLAEQTIAIEERRFALAQRQAKVYADSALVPQEYRGKIGNVLIAQNMAKRMGADTLMVMQNLYIVHGKPGWSAAFLVASFNSNGRFSAIKYRFQGEKHTPEWGCQAYCTENSTGEVIEGTWITWEMATAEGWVSKAGSKWKTMPEQMFRYRAATFLIQVDRAGDRHGPAHERRDRGHGADQRQFDGEPDPRQSRSSQRASDLCDNRKTGRLR